MLKSFFIYCEALSLSEAIRESVWVFPVFQVLHLIGLALLSAAVLTVDLRLMRAVLRNQPINLVSKNMQPLLISGIALMFSSGFLQFISEAVKLYDNDAFWAKMIFLLLAIVFTFSIRRKVIKADENKFRKSSQFIVGFISTALWFAVGFSGRWIAFI